MSVHCVYGALSCFTIATRRFNARKAGTCYSVQQIRSWMFLKEEKQHCMLSHRHSSLTLNCFMNYEVWVDKVALKTKPNIVFVLLHHKWLDLATPHFILLFTFMVIQWNPRKSVEPVCNRSVTVLLYKNKLNVGQVKINGPTHGNAQRRTVTLQHRWLS
jgi:hypothetical protein